ncbi:hypothetical protein LM599_05015 [Candidatus Acetothermia bacterium]|nr:hypothetical protein [Candidatus Acetothermia bacterium]
MNALGVGVIALATTLGVLVSLLLDLGTSPEAPFIAALVALLVIVLLAFLRSFYDILVFVAFALMGVVFLFPNPTDVMVFVLVVIGIVRGYVHLGNVRILGLFNVALALFVLFYIISVLAGYIVHGNASIQFIANLLIKLAILYFLKMYINSADDMRRALSAYVTAGVMVSLVAIGAAEGLFTWSFAMPTWDGRFQALLNDPNVFGNFLVPLFVFLLDDVLKPSIWKIPRLLKFALLVVFGLSILLSGSRSAWLNLAMALTVYGLLVIRRLRFRKAIHASAIVMTIGLLGIWMVNQLGYGSLLIARLGLQPYDAERFFFQLRGVELSMHNFFGVGPGQSEVVLGYATHNLFIQVMLENGWLSLLALIVVLGYVISSLLRRIVTHYENPFGPSYEAIVAILVGLLVNALFIDILYWSILWFLLGVAWVAVWPSPSASPSALTLNSKKSVLTSGGHYR